MTQILLVLASMLGQIDMTADDLHSQLMENALRVQRLRVQWTAESDLTDDGRGADDAAINQLNAILGGELPKEHRDNIAESLKRLREGNRKNRPVLSRVGDYWSDRRNFQSRDYNSPKVGGPVFWGTAPRVVFPDVEATADQLSSVLRGFRVTSYGPATKSRVRVWQGSGGDLATVRGPQSAKDDFWLPPFALPDASLGCVPHPIDEFIQQYLAHPAARVVGECELGGDTVMLVECVKEQQSARGFLNPVSGYPHRIEFFNGTLETLRGLAGPNTAHPGLIAARIVRDIKYAEFDAAGSQVLYPVRCVIQRVEPTNSPKEAVSTAQPGFAIHEVTTWTVQHAAFNLPMSEGNFAMEFPQGTTFQDDATNEVLVVGDAAGQMKRLVRESSPQTKNGSGSSALKWIYGSMCVVAAIGAGQLFLRWRRRTK